MAQLLGEYALLLGWHVQRQLTGAAKRLWCYLGGLEPSFQPTAWPQESALTPAVLASWGFTAARRADQRAKVARAGQRIVTADPRYSTISVDKLPESPTAYQLRAVRHHGDDVTSPTSAAPVGQGPGRQA